MAWKISETAQNLLQKCIRSWFSLREAQDWNIVLLDNIADYSNNDIYNLNEIELLTSFADENDDSIRWTGLY